jgi:hypothetical protein
VDFYQKKEEEAAAHLQAREWCGASAMRQGHARLFIGPSPEDPITQGLIFLY